MEANESAEKQEYRSLWNTFTRVDIPPYYIVIVVLMAVTCAFFTHVMRYNTADDALIYYRYIRNAMEGKGLVYNEGEFHNAMTSPLYMYVSLGAAYIMRDVNASQHVLGGCFLFLASQVILLLYYNKWPRLVLVAVPLMMITCRFFYSTFGLETPLFIFLAILAVWLYLERYYFALGIASALLILSRGEGVFLVLLLIALHFMERRPFPSWRVFIIPTLLLAANYLFNYYYYGHFLPSTLMAKIHHGQSGLYPKWQFLRVENTIRGTFNEDRFLTAIVLLLAWTGLSGLLRDRAARILVIFTILYSLFFLVLNVPKFHWYFGIHFLTLYILVGLGMNALYQLAARKERQSSRTAMLVLLSLLSVIIISRQSVHSYALNGIMDDKSSNYRQIGFWLHIHTEPKDKVACSEIGYIGWYSKRYIVDILGLVSPPNAELLGQKDIEGWLREYQPHYILIHVPPWPVEMGAWDQMGKGIYNPVPEFDFPGFMLLKRHPMFPVKSDELPKS